MKGTKPFVPPADLAASVRPRVSSTALQACFVPLVGIEMWHVANRVLLGVIPVRQILLGVVLPLHCVGNFLVIVGH